METINGMKYLSSKETAKRLGLHAGTLRNQRADDRSPVPFIKIGQTVLYAVVDVTRYLKASPKR